VSNFLDDKILFRFVISNDYIIKFDAHEELFTFKELEKIIASNFGYWNSIYDVAPNDFKSEWEKLKDRYNTIKNNIFELEKLDIENINNQIYYNLTDNYESRDPDTRVYLLTLFSPIDKDIEFRKIRNFVSFYIQQTQNSLDGAIRSFIYLLKNNYQIGAYFSSANKYNYYPALYLLRKDFSNIKENISDFEANIVTPITNKLKDISDNSEVQYKEITTFIEDKHNQIQIQYDEKVSEFAEFKKSLDDWQKEKHEKIKALEDTYENKLSLEAPERLWKKRSKEHQMLAKKWTYFLICAVIALIFALVGLVVVIHLYLNRIQSEIPFISESFILISVISFFIYIVRILIKIVMSNHHLATEYKQKAALTRFYQALTKAGTDIEKEERLIIINSLFSKVETGLVKTDTSNDSDAILALLSKNL
jgi:hypothetical protein